MSAGTPWICTMCGYIHDADAPPQKCPACGSPSELFNPQSAAPAAPQGRHCTMCGFLLEAGEPPEKCPACGSPPELFSQ